MKIIKYTEFIKEELTDTPQTLIEMKLKQLKSKLDKIFQDVSDSPDVILKPDEFKKKDSNEMTFKDLGIHLDSSEISKYSKMYDNLTIKFSDDMNTYTLIIMIDVKDALPGNSSEEDENLDDEEIDDESIEEANEEDFDIDDITKCYIKFKKYNLDTFEIEGQLSKNVDIDDIDENFLIDLKLELDEKFGDSEEEFEIETE